MRRTLWCLLSAVSLAACAPAQSARIVRLPPQMERMIWAHENDLEILEQQRLLVVDALDRDEQDRVAARAELDASLARAEQLVPGVRIDRRGDTLDVADPSQRAAIKAVDLAQLRLRYVDVAYARDRALLDEADAAVVGARALIAFSKERALIDTGNAGDVDSAHDQKVRAETITRAHDRRVTARARAGMFNLEAERLARAVDERARDYEVAARGAHWF